MAKYEYVAIISISHSSDDYTVYYNVLLQFAI